MTLGRVRSRESPQAPADASSVSQLLTEEDCFVAEAAGVRVAPLQQPQPRQVAKQYAHPPFLAKRAEHGE